MPKGKMTKKRISPYDEYRGYLSADAQKAIGVLEKEGWKLFVDTKIEESGEKDGKRRRTFRNEGRYQLVLAQKKVRP